MNKNSFSESYKAAGVDVTAGYRAVDLMKSHVGRTMTPLRKVEATRGLIRSTDS